MKLSFFRHAFMVSIAVVCGCGSPDELGNDEEISFLDVEEPDSVFGSVTWSWCAPEGGVCNFSGRRLVRYGAVSSFVTQEHTDGVTCANTVFGDPLYGTHKACWTATYVPPQPPASNAPIGDLTNIYALEQSVLYVKQGQNVTLPLRFYGRALPDNAKPFIHLFTMSGAYAGGLENHYWKLPSQSWGGYVSFPNYVANASASLPPGNYRISVGLYQGQPPYTPYYWLVQGNGVSHPSGDLNNQGWIIGTLVVEPYAGPADPSVTTTPQQMRVLTPVPWN